VAPVSVPAEHGRILDCAAPVLKIELHSHTSDDPLDLILYDARTLVARAAECGYGALAITLHDRQLDLGHLVPFAREHGVTLIPGIERTVQGRHVLLLNFSSGGAERVRSFDDIRRLRAHEPGLVVAPHPFFPFPTCLQSLADQHQDIFDAVEINGMFTAVVNFNRKAERWARERGLPLVGNGDVHRLDQLNTTWSMVDAEAHPDSICLAIREGRVRVEAHPHTMVKAATIFGDMVLADLRQGIAALTRSHVRPSVSNR
jgi:predicted metal-dependent phosphoesterase TrpH